VKISSLKSVKTVKTAHTKCPRATILRSKRLAGDESSPAIGTKSLGQFQMMTIPLNFFEALKSTQNGKFGEDRFMRVAGITDPL